MNDQQFDFDKFAKHLLSNIETYMGIEKGNDSFLNKAMLAFKGKTMPLPTRLSKDSMREMLSQSLCDHSDKLKIDCIALFLKIFTDFNRSARKETLQREIKSLEQDEKNKAEKELQKLESLDNNTFSLIDVKRTDSDSEIKSASLEWNDGKLQYRRGDEAPQPLQTRLEYFLLYPSKNKENTGDPSVDTFFHTKTKVKNRLKHIENLWDRISLALSHYLYLNGILFSEEDDADFPTIDRCFQSGRTAKSGQHCFLDLFARILTLDYESVENSGEEEPEEEEEEENENSTVELQTEYENTVEYNITKLWWIISGQESDRQKTWEKFLKLEKKTGSVAKFRLSKFIDEKLSVLEQWANVKTDETDNEKRLNALLDAFKHRQNEITSIGSIINEGTVNVNLNTLPMVDPTWQKGPSQVTYGLDWRALNSDILYGYDIDDNDLIGKIYEEKDAIQRRQRKQESSKRNVYTHNWVSKVKFSLSVEQSIYETSNNNVEFNIVEVEKLEEVAEFLTDEMTQTYEGKRRERETYNSQQALDPKRRDNRLHPTVNEETMKEILQRSIIERNLDDDGRIRGGGRTTKNLNEFRLIIPPHKYFHQLEKLLIHLDYNMFLKNENTVFNEWLQVPWGEEDKEILQCVENLMIMRNAMKQGSGGRNIKIIHLKYTCAELLYLLSKQSEMCTFSELYPWSKEDHETIPMHILLKTCDELGLTRPELNKDEILQQLNSLFYYSSVKDMRYPYMKWIGMGLLNDLYELCKPASDNEYSDEEEYMRIYYKLSVLLAVVNKTDWGKNPKEIKENIFSNVFGYANKNEFIPRGMYAVHTDGNQNGNVQLNLQQKENTYYVEEDKKEVLKNVFGKYTSFEIELGDNPFDTEEFRNFYHDRTNILIEEDERLTQSKNNDYSAFVEMRNNFLACETLYSGKIEVRSENNNFKSVLVHDCGARMFSYFSNKENNERVEIEKGTIWTLVYSVTPDLIDYIYKSSFEANPLVHIIDHIDRRIVYGDKMRFVNALLPANMRNMYIDIFANLRTPTLQDEIGEILKKDDESKSSVVFSVCIQYLMYCLGNTISPSSNYTRAEEWSPFAKDIHTISLFALKFVQDVKTEEDTWSKELTLLINPGDDDEAYFDQYFSFTDQYFLNDNDYSDNNPPKGTAAKALEPYKRYDSKFNPKRFDMFKISKAYKKGWQSLWEMKGYKRFQRKTIDDALTYANEENDARKNPNLEAYTDLRKYPNVAKHYFKIKMIDDLFVEDTFSRRVDKKMEVTQQQVNLTSLGDENAPHVQNNSFIHAIVIGMVSLYNQKDSYNARSYQNPWKIQMYHYLSLCFDPKDYEPERFSRPSDYEDDDKKNEENDDGDDSLYKALNACNGFDLDLMFIHYLLKVVHFEIRFPANETRNRKHVLQYWRDITMADLFQLLIAFKRKEELYNAVDSTDEILQGIMVSKIRIILKKRITAVFMALPYRTKQGKIKKEKLEALSGLWKEAKSTLSGLNTDLITRLIQLLEKATPNFEQIQKILIETEDTKKTLQRMNLPENTERTINEILENNNVSELMKSRDKDNKKRNTKDKKNIKTLKTLEDEHKDIMRVIKQLQNDTITTEKVLEMMASQWGNKSKIKVYSELTSMLKDLENVRVQYTELKNLLKSEKTKEVIKGISILQNKSGSIDVAFALDPKKDVEDITFNCKFCETQEYIYECDRCGSNWNDPNALTRTAKKRLRLTGKELPIRCFKCVYEESKKLRETLFYQDVDDEDDWTHARSLVETNNIRVDAKKETLLADLVAIDFYHEQKKSEKKKSNSDEDENEDEDEDAMADLLTNFVTLDIYSNSEEVENDLENITKQFIENLEKLPPRAKAYVQNFFGDEITSQKIMDNITALVDMFYTKSYYITEGDDTTPDAPVPKFYFDVMKTYHKLDCFCESCFRMIEEYKNEYCVQKSNKVRDFLKETLNAGLKNENMDTDTLIESLNAVEGNGVATRVDDINVSDMILDKTDQILFQGDDMFINGAVCKRILNKIVRNKAGLNLPVFPKADGEYTTIKLDSKNLRADVAFVYIPDGFNDYTRKEEYLKLRYPKEHTEDEIFLRRCADTNGLCPVDPGIECDYNQCLKHYLRSDIETVVGNKQTEVTNRDVFAWGFSDDSKDVNDNPAVKTSVQESVECLSEFIDEYKADTLQQKLNAIHMLNIRQFIRYLYYTGETEDFNVRSPIALTHLLLGPTSYSVDDGQITIVSTEMKQIAEDITNVEKLKDDVEKQKKQKKQKKTQLKGGRGIVNNENKPYGRWKVENDSDDDNNDDSSDDEGVEWTIDKEDVSDNDKEDVLKDALKKNTEINEKIKLYNQQRKKENISGPDPRLLKLPNPKNSGQTMDFIKIPIPTDGYCGHSAVVRAINLNREKDDKMKKKDLVSKLKELEKNRGSISINISYATVDSEYEITAEKVKTEIKKYKKLSTSPMDKNYWATEDTMAIYAHILKATIYVYVSHWTTGFFSEHWVKFGNDSEEIIYLYKTADHFDLLKKKKKKRARENGASTGKEKKKKIELTKKRERESGASTVKDKKKKKKKKEKVSGKRKMDQRLTRKIKVTF